MSLIKSLEKVINKIMDINKIIKNIESEGQKLFKGINEYNIVYIEGYDPVLDKVNNDKFNEWNDVRLIFSYVGDKPQIDFMQIATTEPGLKATNNPSNKLGVARIQLGQYTAWKMGYHKFAKLGKQHPALVQSSNVPVCRDFDKDGFRTGDKIDIGMFGINQHSTKMGYNGTTVEDWSEGCLVGKNWSKHLRFLAILKKDARYVADNNFEFTTTIIDGTKL
jgi:hypothetical protein